MELDSSVSFTTVGTVNVSSPLGPEEFEDKILSILSYEARAEDLGCGRVVCDYSIILQTRYVMCDIYEEEKSSASSDPGTAANPAGIAGPGPGAAPDRAQGDTCNRYRIEIKVGKRVSRIADALFCVLFLLCFWFLRSFFARGFNPLFLVIAGIILAAGVYLFIALPRYRFGQEESLRIKDAILRNFGT